MPKRIGALVSVLPLSLAFAATVAQAPAQTARNSGAYSVNGLDLGAQISSDSAPYRDYRCGPSEQFDGFTWCQRMRQERERRTTSSLLHSRDGKIAYINRQQEPVSWDGNEIDEEIRAYSRRLGSQPRITRLPRRSGSPEGVLALWGEVTIEPLDGDSIKILADGKSPRKGFLVDYLGNLVRSAQDGLPVYRITGGPGLIWVASHDQRGRGTLRITAVDTSAMSPPVATTPAPTAVAEAAEPKPVAERPTPGATLQTDPADAKDGGADAEAAQDDGRIVAATQVQAAADAAPPAIDTARKETAQSANDRAVAETEIARLKFAVGVAYSLIGGLLLLLLALFVRLLVLKSRSRAGHKASAAIASGKLAGVSSNLNMRVDERRLPPIVLNASDGASAPVAIIVPDKPAEQIPAHDPASPALASASAAEQQASAVSLVPDDVSEPAAVGEIDHSVDENHSIGEEPVKRLTELSKLRASGMLTESEFNQLKSAIIASVSQNPAPSP